MDGARKKLHEHIETLFYCKIFGLVYYLVMTINDITTIYLGNAKADFWIDRETGVIVEEVWEDSNGAWHRSGAPSVVVRDRLSESVLQEEWNFHGVQHRDDGPALRRFDPKTGVCTLEEWWRNDKYHRECGPAVVRRDPSSGEIIESEHWTDGVRHGWSTDQSARAMALRLAVEHSP